MLVWRRVKQPAGRRAAGAVRNATVFRDRSGSRLARFSDYDMARSSTNGSARPTPETLPQYAARSRSARSERGWG